MNELALDSLIECQRALLAALDARDAGAIEVASAALLAAVEVTKAADIWDNHAGAKPKLDYALKQIDAAQTRVNFLADWTCQKIEKLSDLRGATVGDAYKKTRNLGAISYRR
jgi:hypothetical protein